MLSPDQIRRIMRHRSLPKYAQAHADNAAKYMPEFGIKDPKEVAMVFATIGVETDFRILEENMSYTAKRIRQVWPTRFKSVAAARPYARNPRKLANNVYGRRMGNRGRKDAGYLYRGSGPGQTTGYNEFKAMADATGIDVVNNPDILRTDPEAGMRAFLIFWVGKKGIRAAAQKGNTRRVRKLVNGGYHGYDKFVKLYDRAIKMIQREGFGYKGIPDDSSDIVGSSDNVSDDAYKEKTYSKNKKSGILPMYRPKQSEAMTRAVLAKYENLTPEDRRDDKVKVLFVRGYYANSFGKVGQNDRGVYDDAVFIVTPDGVQNFNGNADPSKYRKRIATIKGNQAIRYRPGLHGYKRKNGPYPAFRQDLKTTVVRDGIGDDYGMFHVNLHRGGDGYTSSAGCLTVPTSQWNEFRDMLKAALKKHGQKNFYVTLVEYAGDNPPVTVVKSVTPDAPVADPTKPPKLKPKETGIMALFVGIGATVYNWGTDLSSWIGSLFCSCLG
jgi:predicted chitinase